MTRFSNAIYALIVLPALFGVCKAQGLDIDLSHWGYRAPDKNEIRPPIVFRPHYVSLSDNGDVAVAFVTHDRRGLVTRERPALTFHVLQFDRVGNLLFQRAFPTESWFDNDLEFTSKGTLLVRAGENLLITGKEDDKSVTKPSSTQSTLRDWRVQVTPDRQQVVVYHFSEDKSDIEILDSASLTTIQKCPFSRYALLSSISDDSIAAMLPAPPNHAGLRRVEVAEICGRSRFEYSWNDGPSGALLLKDDLLVIAGYSPRVSVVAARTGATLWDRSFGGYNTLINPHLEKDSRGEVFAFIVEKPGGSQMFDISPSLKNISVVSGSLCGAATSEIRVSPLPQTAFSFTLSPDGSLMGYVSDHHLHVQAADNPRCASGKNSGSENPN